MSTITLRGSDLFEREGFESGHVMFDPLWQAGFEEMPVDVEEDEQNFPRLVLIHAVRLFLLPRLPEGLAVEELITIHNPIRASSDTPAEVKARACQISVVVPVDSIVALALRLGGEILPERSGEADE